MKGPCRKTSSFCKALLTSAIDDRRSLYKFCSGKFVKPLSSWRASVSTSKYPSEEEESSLEPVIKQGMPNSYLSLSLSSSIPSFLVIMQKDIIILARKTAGMTRKERNKSLVRTKIEKVKAGRSPLAPNFYLHSPLCELFLKSMVLQTIYTYGCKCIGNFQIIIEPHLICLFRTMAL